MLMEAEGCLGNGMVTSALGYPGVVNVGEYLRESGWGDASEGKVGGWTCFPA